MRMLKHQLPLPVNVLETRGPVMSAGFQDGHVVVWALDDESRPRERRRVLCFNTGDEVPLDLGRMTFVGTVVSRTGVVWHVVSERLT